MPFYDRKPLRVEAEAVDDIYEAWMDEQPEVMALFQQPDVGVATLRWDDETDPEILVVWDSVGQSTYNLSIMRGDVLILWPDGHYDGMSADNFALVFDPAP